MCVCVERVCVCGKPRVVVVTSIPTLLPPPIACSRADQELQHLRNSLPDTVEIQRVEERLSVRRLNACGAPAVATPPLFPWCGFCGTASVSVLMVRFLSSLRPLCWQALGNVIACNDYVALVHPDLEKVRRRLCVCCVWLVFALLRPCLAAHASSIA